MYNISALTIYNIPAPLGNTGGTAAMIKKVWKKKIYRNPETITWSLTAENTKKICVQNLSLDFSMWLSVVTKAANFILSKGFKQRQF
jgi:hypothetical protein